jgi:hypothetical protein
MWPRRDVRNQSNDDGEDHDPVGQGPVPDRSKIHPSSVPLPGRPAKRFQRLRRGSLIWLNLCAAKWYNRTILPHHTKTAHERQLAPQSTGDALDAAKTMLRKEQDEIVQLLTEASACAERAVLAFEADQHDEARRQLERGCNVEYDALSDCEALGRLFEALYPESD